MPRGKGKVCRPRRDISARKKKLAKADENRANTTFAAAHSHNTRSHSAAVRTEDEWHVVNNTKSSERQANDDIKKKKKKRSRLKKDRMCRLDEHGHTINDLSNNHTIIEDVYEDPVTMSNKLRQHLSNLTINQDVLPMDTSNFYEVYFLSSSNEEEFDVHRSSYHTLSNFLLAMEKEQLIILRKKWQTDKKFRKHATSKEVVMVGKENVTQYLKSKRGRATGKQKGIVVSDGDDVVEEHTGDNDTKIASDYTTMNLDTEEHSIVHHTKEEINEQLANHLANLQVNSNELPMEVGNFFTKHFRNTDDVVGDINKSKYRSVTKFMRAMEKEGLVTLKKRTRGRSAPLVVVAVGKEQVRNLKCFSVIWNHLMMRVRVVLVKSHTLISTLNQQFMQRRDKSIELYLTLISSEQ